MKKIFAVMILITCFAVVAVLYYMNYVVNIFSGKKPNLTTNRWLVVDLFVDAGSYAIDIINS